MRVVEAEGIQRVAVIQPQVTVAVGVGKRDNALAAEGAVGIEEVGEARVVNQRLYFIILLYWFSF